jgi:hypothetical protein
MVGLQSYETRTTDNFASGVVVIKVGAELGWHWVKFTSTTSSTARIISRDLSGFRNFKIPAIENPKTDNPTDFLQLQFPEVMSQISMVTY